MKVKDLVQAHPEIEDADECSLCKLHEVAAEVITHMECPCCGYLITVKMGELEDPGGARYPLPDLEFILLPVGSTNNGVEAEEEIRKYPVATCQGCDNILALVPTPIIYNANHDVYYTGGKHYLTDEIRIGDRLKEKIEQWVLRREQGEELRVLELDTWLKYEVEHIIAEYLVGKGMKLA